MKQEAAIILPSLVVAYHVPSIDLDVGVRLSAGQATLESTTALWGTLSPNYEEDIKKDAVFAVDATDSFVPAFGVGATYRPTRSLELAASFSSGLDIHAHGTATSQLGPSAGVPGMAVSIGPVADARARCDTGGTADALKACVDLALPMTAQVAGRYKLLDEHGRLTADVELDLGWENWGKSCDDADLLDGSCLNPSNYRVVVDATTQAPGLDGTPQPLIPLKDAVVRHGLQDTLSARVGGSYHLAVGAPRADHSTNEVILRGGLGYETAAAKTGWLRADLDGAARTTLTVGAAYRTSRFEISAGGGVILEGSPSNPNVGGGAEPCNPTVQPVGGAPACGSADRQGPDPINPVFEPRAQDESPVNQGDYKAHYTLLMLGVTTWF